MYLACLDEAGHFENPDCLYVGMAGFIAPEKLWSLVEDLWRNIISVEFRLAQPFHMTDFAHRKGQFTGWEEGKRKELLGKLVDVILLAEPIPIATVVSIEDYRSLNAEQQYFLEAHTICVSKCALEALLYSRVRTTLLGWSIVKIWSMEQSSRSRTHTLSSLETLLSSSSR